MKYTSALKLKLIYVFRVNYAMPEDCLKICEGTSDNEYIWSFDPNSKTLNEAILKRTNNGTFTVYQI